VTVEKTISLDRDSSLADATMFVPLSSARLRIVGAAPGASR
jgi:hypothetical protein